jgi:hypothetical protein
MVWGSLLANNYSASVATRESNLRMVYSNDVLAMSGVDCSMVEIHICADIHEFCLECNVKVPNEPIPKLAWISVSDKISGIGKRLWHPFAFFEQDSFDAVNSCFNRTTTPSSDGPSNNPPLRVGTPSHVKGECGGACKFIDKDAWVDFENCAPIEGSKLWSTLKHKQNIDSTLIARFKRQTISTPLYGRELGAKSCESENPDITAQLWIALRLSRGHKW